MILDTDLCEGVLPVVATFPWVTVARWINHPEGSDLPHGSWITRVAQETCYWHWPSFVHMSKA